MNIRTHSVIEDERPVKKPHGESGLDDLISLLRATWPVTILSGAGCSTESGIPDYRGPDGMWRSRRPVMFADFVRDESARRSYWARSYRGWIRFRNAQPNAAHHALARLERAGHISLLVTQNVDGLHQAAASRKVLELHGSNRRVVCLSCARHEDREALQRRLEGLNRGWSVEGGETRPDGDAEIDRALTADFIPAGCFFCDGILKPDVVFFGESVPKDRVEAVRESIDRSGALLIVGSSLAVWSGYRFARYAAETTKPVAIINRGWTRADDLASVKVDFSCSEALGAIADLCE